MSGREIFAQVFQNDKAVSFLENKDHQEDIPKVFTLAREKVDSV